MFEKVKWDEYAEKYNELIADMERVNINPKRLSEIIDLRLLLDKYWINKNPGSG